MNNACGAKFTKGEMEYLQCTYHPGVFQFGSHNVSIFYLGLLARSLDMLWFKMGSFRL